MVRWAGRRDRAGTSPGEVGGAIALFPAEGGVVDPTNAVAGLGRRPLLAEGAEEPVAQAFTGGRFVPLDRAPDVAAAVQASIKISAVIVRGTAAQITEVGSLVGAPDVCQPQRVIGTAIAEVAEQPGSSRARATPRPRRQGHGLFQALDVEEEVAARGARGPA